ncbi:MAG: pilus assembly PilX N-terminal domain-containing protein, partial [Acidobacteriota bacterium]
MRIENFQISKNDAGVALVSTLLFLAVLGILATALVFTVQNEMKSSTAYKYTEQAFYVANSGVQKSVAWFRNNYQPLIDSSVDPTASNTGAENYDTAESPVEYNNNPVMLAGQTGSTSVFPNNGSGYASSFAGSFGNASLTADSYNAGVYAVDATLLKHSPSTFIDPTTFISYPSAVERWRINSIGYWGGTTNPLGISNIEAIIENSGNALFDRALWGIDDTDLGGTVLVDSYDPALGNYDPVTNRGEDGSVGSNGSVSAVGTVDIYGDLAYGPTGSYSAGPNITVTGDTTQMAEERYFPPIPPFDIPAGSTSYSPINSDVTLSPGTYGSLNIRNNATISLEPGTYYIDEIAQAATGTLEITGETTLFVKSGLDLDGMGVINPSGDPTQLTIYYDGTSEASFVGGSSSFMEVYAPEA